MPAHPDLEPYDVESLKHGGEMGGDYLDELGKTDLASLSPGEWDQFLYVVCFAFLRRRIDLMPCPF